MTANDTDRLARFFEHDQADHDAVAELLAHLGEHWDGAAPLDEMQQRWSTAIIEGALDRDPLDKRRGPRLKAGLVDGRRWCWLSTTGWQIVGKSNRREHRPSAGQMRHRFAGINCRRWLESELKPVGERVGILTTVLAGGPLRTFIEEQTSVAWGAVRIGGPRGEESGRLLHGPLPDLLLIQSFPEEQAELRSRLWPHLVGITSNPGGLFDHELRVAIEIELSEKADISGKIQNNQAAANLGWFHATLWVTDTPAVATRLLRSMRALSTAGDEIAHHYFAHTADVGIDPAGPAVVTPTWQWPLYVRHVRQQDLLDGGSRTRTNKR
jgi:hypothetical protein